MDSAFSSGIRSSDGACSRLYHLRTLDLKFKTKAEQEWEKLFRDRLKGIAVLRIIQYLVPFYIIAVFADFANDNFSDDYSHPPLIDKLIGGFFLVFISMALYVIIACIYTSIKTGHTPKS